MEKPPERSRFSFPPHRRSHLKSETYRNLVRILSLCYGESPLATAPPIIPLHLMPDQGVSQAGQATQKEICEPEVLVFPQRPKPGEVAGLATDKEMHESEEFFCPQGTEPGELVDPYSRQPDNLPAPESTVVGESSETASFLDRRHSGTQMAINEIGRIMQIEENFDLLKRDDSMVHKNTEGTSLHDREFGLQQTLMNELDIMKRNDKDLLHNSIHPSATLLEENQRNCVAELINNGEEDVIQQTLVEKMGQIGESQLDQEDVRQKVSEASNLPVEVSKSSQNNEVKSSFMRINELEENDEVQEKEMELEKSVCHIGAMASPSHMVEDGGPEEGEISGEVCNELANIVSEGALFGEEVGEKRVSEGKIDIEELAYNKHKGYNENCSESISFTMNAREVALEENSRNQIVHEPKELRKERGNGAKDGTDSQFTGPNNRLLLVEMSEKSGNENQGITSQEKQDSDLCNKKKRNPLSKEKKEKKKKRERKRRAEKNRRLGVKRLKLQPVLNQKPVTYCNHYLKGRCYEGEKCKFSHDTVPLTKSTPCCYFARHSCMKGDNCPFDHQLSKYPCSNYMAKGFCIRGDSCLFSHKISPQEDAPSPSNVGGTQPKSYSNLEKQVSAGGASRKNLYTSSSSVMHRSAKQNAVQTLTKPHSLAPKGVSCLPAIKSPVGESNMLNKVSLFPERNETGKIEIHTNPSAPAAVENVNDGPKRTPGGAPRGINFLSFGKARSNDSNGERASSLPLNKGNDYKQSPSKDDGSRLVSQMSQTATRIGEPINDMPKKTQPPFTALGVNFLSLEKAFMDNSTSTGQSSLPSSLNNVNGGSVQRTEHASEKEHNIGTNLLKLPTSLLSPGQSSKQLAEKNTPNSAQKTLMSTLAFAAKFEKGKDISVQKSQHAYNKQSNLSVISQRPSASPFATGQSSEQSTSQNTPKSSQKALISTLAFAAKFDSDMRKNRSAGSNIGVGNGVNKEAVDSSMNAHLQNDSVKASRILDFLSTISSKLKQ